MATPQESGPVVANKSYATPGVYRERVDEAERTGRCFFCSDTFRSNPALPILSKVTVGASTWFARERDPEALISITEREGRYPKLWILLVKDEHGLEYTEEDAIALYRLEKWAEESFGIPRAYAIGQRMGPGAGMVIVHGLRHLMVPETVEVDGETVLDPYYFPVG